MTAIASGVLQSIRLFEIQDWPHAGPWFHPRQGLMILIPVSVGPVGLLPVYFHLEVLYFVFKRRDWIVSFYRTLFGVHMHDFLQNCTRR